MNQKFQQLQSFGVKLVKTKYTNSIEIFIEGDYNDADLVTKTSFRSVEEFEELIPIFRKILTKERDFTNGTGNLEGDYLSIEEHNLLSDLIPNVPDEYHDIFVYHLTQIRCYFRCSTDRIRYKIEL